jgi:Predicted transcriptional regulator
MLSQKARYALRAMVELARAEEPQLTAGEIAARADAPRNPKVKALWSALAREHEQLRRSERGWPFSATECFLAGLVLLWIGALLLVLLRRHRVPAAAVLLLAAGALGTGALLRYQHREPRAVLAGGASLRLSPHGLAPERGTVLAFSIVRLDRRLGSWWLIETAEGTRGWVPEEILAETPR